MIFVTVGSQMPFKRLIEGVAAWAMTQSEMPNVLAQVGDMERCVPELRTVRSLSPEEFRAAVLGAEVIIAHAGMGSVLTAMEFGKPLVVLPRKGALRETRNDHQIATARWLAAKGGVFVAMEDEDLADAIDRARASTRTTSQISSHASADLVEALRIFIQS
ncbi:glycosyltransferase [Azonexus sp.]|uniref:glycosyltransferase n=1 Tax=Azonexus sp. TaxID=1872668 RepID=UPI0035B0F0EE